MPGFNGRGPNGQGPLTGGGRGRCAGEARADQAQGRGRGMGPCGGGRARGRGRGMGYGQGYGSVAVDPAAQDLRAEAEGLRRRLAQVEAQQKRQGPDVD